MTLLQQEIDSLRARAQQYTAEAESIKSQIENMQARSLALLAEGIEFASLANQMERLK